MIRLAIIAAMLLGASVAHACEVPVLSNARIPSDAKGFDLVFRFVPTQPKVGEFFVVEFASCAIGAPIGAETFRIDAIMPAHKHGMNFQPKISVVGPGLYRAEGLMFHMPGTWQLTFEQRTPSGPMRVTATVEIE